LALCTDPPTPHSIAIALLNDGKLHLVLRDTWMMVERADEMLSIASEQGNGVHLIVATFFRGWAMAAAGRGAEGIAEMRRSISVPYLAECRRVP
jgi:hypothetical protein